jgi:signal transduction histidine kinase
MKNSPEQSESAKPRSCLPQQAVSRGGGGQASTEAEELGRLLGVIAHEIKNPLSTIKVNLRLVDEDLRNGSAGDIEQRLARASRKLSIIDKEAARLEQILDSFLHYADRTQPRLAAVDVNFLVGDMVDFFLPQALAHSITVRQALHKEPLLCRLDPDMLKQAILNLFINAQQAMGKNGELMVRTAPVGRFAHIQISDTGKGIPPDRLARLFEPYQSTRPDGSGLGLATVKKIIDAHKGTVSVVSEPGKGTSFTIALPLSSPSGEVPA